MRFIRTCTYLVIRMCFNDNILSHILFPYLQSLERCGASGLLGRVHSKERYFKFTCIFLSFFLLFFTQKKCAFIIFISFFDKVSHFCNKILANQKPELVIRICQWNCMIPYSAKQQQSKNFPTTVITEYINILNVENY